MSKTFDKCLEYVGQFGPYQKRRFLLLSLYSAVCCGWSLGVTVFLIMPPPHRCAMPPRENLPSQLRGLDEGNLTAVLIPMEPDAVGVSGLAKCRMRDLESVAALLEGKGMQQPLPAELEEVETVACTHGWWFDPEEKWTIVAEYNLVCGRDHFGHTLMTINSVGSIVGTYVFAILQDKMGRKPSLVLILLYYIVLSTVGVFMPTIEAFIVSTTLRSVAGIALFQIPYILSLEMVTVAESSLIINGMSIVFSLGFAVLPLIAWLCHSWKGLVLATTCPFALFFSYWWLIDESPRWQLTQGRVDSAVKTLVKMGKENKVAVGEAEMEEVVAAVLAAEAEADEHGKEAEEGEETKESDHIDRVQPKQTRDREHAQLDGVEPVQVQSVSILHLFRHKRLVLPSFAMAFLWCANAMVYSGITLNTANFGGNPYIVFSAIALSEIPAEVFNLFVVDRVGRIWPSAICMTVAGLSLVGTVFVPSDQPWALLGLVVLGKFCITASFCTLYQLGAELFPTVFRATGIGFATTVSQIMGLATPFIIYAGSRFPVLPMSLLGALSLLGGFVTLFLPETLGIPLPDTVGDLERSGGIGPRSLMRNIRCRRKVPMQNAE